MFINVCAISDSDEVVEEDEADKVRSTIVARYDKVNVFSSFAMIVVHIS